MDWLCKVESGGPEEVERILANRHARRSGLVNAWIRLCLCF